MTECDHVVGRYYDGYTGWYDVTASMQKLKNLSGTEDYDAANFCKLCGAALTGEWGSTPQESGNYLCRVDPADDGYIVYLDRNTDSVRAGVTEIMPLEAYKHFEWFSVPIAGPGE